MGLFSKNKKAKNKAEKSSIKPINYPPKILIAWGEAISGNSKILDWLMKNGYPELGIFCHALKNDVKGKDWLMNNGYPHLLAMISAGEGDEIAIKWLTEFDFDLLKYMGLAIDNHPGAKKWLREYDMIYATLAFKMAEVKNHIEMRNNDPHTLNI